MSTTELEAFTNHNTKKALEELQQYLKKNPDEAMRTQNLLRDAGKPGEESLLNRFVSGSYEGRPSKKVVAPLPSVFYRYRYVFVGLLGLCVSMLVGYFVLNSK